MDGTISPDKNTILTLLCEEAVQAIEDVLHTPPRERRQIVDFGECAVVRLRDALIDRTRSAADPDVRAPLRTALVQANTALSLITGVEYPGAGIQDRPMKMALEMLRKIRID